MLAGRQHHRVDGADDPRPHTPSPGRRRRASRGNREHRRRRQISSRRVGAGSQHPARHAHRQPLRYPARERVARGSAPRTFDRLVAKRGYFLAFTTGWISRAIICCPCFSYVTVTRSPGLRLDSSVRSYTLNVCSLLPRSILCCSSVKLFVSAFTALTSPVILWVAAATGPAIRPSARTTLKKTTNVFICAPSSAARIPTNSGGTATMRGSETRANCLGGSRVNLAGLGVALPASRMPARARSREFGGVSGWRNRAHGLHVIDPSEVPRGAACLLSIQRSFETPASMWGGCPMSGGT